MNVDERLYTQILDYIERIEKPASIATFLQKNGLVSCATDDPKFSEAWYKQTQDTRILVQYRYYDTSKALSVRPDMNVYLVKHENLSGTVQSREVRFLDKSL